MNPVNTVNCHKPASCNFPHSKTFKVNELKFFVKKFLNLNKFCCFFSACKTSDLDKKEEEF